MTTEDKRPSVTPDEATQRALDDLLYAEHMGDVMNGVKALCRAQNWDEPIHDGDPCTNGYVWPKDQQAKERARDFD